MKQTINYHTCIPFILLMVFCFRNDQNLANKFDAELLQDSTILVNSPAHGILNEALTECNCGTTIENEPTYVQGVYVYPPIPLTFENCGYQGESMSGVSLSYSALQCENKFTIVSPTGSVLYDSGWVSYSGGTWRCLPNCTLIVYARSSVRRLDRWRVSFSGCTSCI